jgi:hypothetical protein
MMVVVASDGAAAVKVRVGNGAQTLVFEDHLLLGRSDANVNSIGGNNASWKILSKTFSPQSWQTDHLLLQSSPRHRHHH